MKDIKEKQRLSKYTHIFMLMQCDNDASPNDWHEISEVNFGSALPFWLLFGIVPKRRLVDHFEKHHCTTKIKNFSFQCREQWTITESSVICAYVEESPLL